MEKKFQTHSNSDNELWLYCVLHQKYTDLSPLILMNKTCHPFLSLSNRIIWEFYSPSEILTEIWAVLHGSFPSKQQKYFHRSSRRYRLCAVHCAPKRMWALRFENDFFIGQRNVHFSKRLCSSSYLAVILPGAKTSESRSEARASFQSTPCWLMRYIVDTVTKQHISNKPKYYTSNSNVHLFYSVRMPPTALHMYIYWL